MMNLADTEKAFSSLRTDRNKNRWLKTTINSAPHKPFLLLAIMDHIAQGLIVENFIEPSIDLVDTFNAYWSLVMPMEMRNGSMAYPFARLTNDGLWELIPAQGEVINIDTITSMRKLTDVCVGAKFHDDVFQFLLLPDSRERLRAMIISTYFENSICHLIESCGVLNQNSYEYSKAVLAAEISPRYLKKVEEKVRDQGFRRAIVSLYEHRCAICGIRIRTEEGHTVVDAAHIIPWSISHDDQASNGMALCKLCHWTYDEGMISIDAKYTVEVSTKIQTEKNLLGHIMTFSGRKIFTPEIKKHWPNPENLDWHKKEKFRKPV